ncbi:MAG: hypothetical protein DGJ47_000174 [Rickettsiaceae bacterium]
MKRKFWLIVVLCFFIVASFIYFIYSQKNSVIPTLEEAHGPTKIRPKEAGGIVIPNSDSLIYQDSSHLSKKVVILPSPEQPLDITFNRKRKNEIIYTDSIDDILNNIEYYEQIYVDQPTEDKNAEDDFILPNLISSEKIISDKDPKLMVKNTRLNIIRSKEKRFEKLNLKNFVNDNFYKVQISVAFTENSARSKWNQLQQKHIKALLNTNLLLQRAKGINGKIYYLVMAGPYNSLSKAKHVCRQLISNHQNCIVTK